MTGNQYVRLLIVVFGLSIAILAVQAFAESGQGNSIREFLASIDEFFREERESGSLQDAEAEVVITSTPDRQFPTSEEIPPTAQPTKTSEDTEVQSVEFTAIISCDEGITRAALRRSPGYLTKDDEVDVLEEIPCGSIVELLGESRPADNIIWWKARWNGTVGWIAGNTGSGKTILIFDGSP